MMQCRLIATAFVVLAAAAVQVTAFAGGLGDDHGDGTDAIFFGVVQDTRGAPIAGAHISVKFNTMSFVATTDAIGGYRIAVPTDPDQSQLSCRKDGYEQTGINRRTPPGAEKAPVEIDCTLKKLP
jgi:hypothetical protein